MGQGETREEAALFSGPEDIVRCWARGIPGGCKALPIEREGQSSSIFDRRARLAHRTERYVVACAVMREAQQKLGLNETLLAVLKALLLEDLDWHAVAERAGLDDGRITADAVKHRVHRAYNAALRCVREAMDARTYRVIRAEE
jgi:hypothetical protein